MTRNGERLGLAGSEGLQGADLAPLRSGRGAPQCLQVPGGGIGAPRRLHLRGR